ncbi:MAG TPA: double zinc ribbon domain-containing protein [Gaiellaceae bacterium]|nr:double zinc ribbon domain-containing protein [Gaiellaceae bacterium]
MLDLVLPQSCLVCREGGTQLCEACARGLPALRPPVCERCGAPTAWPVQRCRECGGRRLGFATARAATAYEGEVRRVVAAWKERGLRRLAQAAAAVVADRLAAPSADLVTFVPADSERRLRRGHHPAAQLAESLARLWQLPCEPRLVRTGSSVRQRGLSLAERRRNVVGAFRADDDLKGTVLLVDDVYTSGATASAAASALRAAGAARIDVITFTRAI